MRASDEAMMVKERKGTRMESASGVGVLRELVLLIAPMIAALVRFILQDEIRQIR